MLTNQIPSEVVERQALTQLSGILHTIQQVRNDSIESKRIVDVTLRVMIVAVVIRKTMRLEIFVPCNLIECLLMLQN